MSMLRKSLPAYKDLELHIMIPDRMIDKFRPR